VSYRGRQFNDGGQQTVRWLLLTEHALNRRVEQPPIFWRIDHDQNLACSGNGLRLDDGGCRRTDIVLELNVDAVNDIDGSTDAWFQLRKPQSADGRQQWCCD